MNRFFTENRIWPPGCTRVHVYFVPDLSELKPLLDAYRPVLEEFDFISLIPDEWLHVTVKMISEPCCQEMSKSQLSELESRLGKEFNKVAPFTMVAGGAVAGDTSLVIDLVPDRHFAELVTRAENVVGDLFGAKANPRIPERPHLTLGYGVGQGDSGVINSKLRRATGQRPILTISELLLVEVRQDSELGQYTWKDLACIPLVGC